MRLDSAVLTLVLFFITAMTQPGISLGTARAFSVAMAFVLGVSVVYALACWLLKLCKFRLPSGETMPFLAMFNIAMACFMLHSLVGMFLHLGR